MPSTGGAPTLSRRQLLLHLVCHYCLLVQTNSVLAHYGRFDAIDALDERICGLRRWQEDKRGQEDDSASEQQDSVPRVSSGWNAARGEFPWNVLMRLDFRSKWSHFSALCGGSIIHHNLILTAAHCMEAHGFAPTNITVWAGLIDKTETGGSQMALADRQCKSTLWKGFMQRPYHDLAIVKLKSSILYNDDVRPICIHHPEHSTQPIYERCIVSGFGTIDHRDPSEPAKWSNKLQGLSQELCDPSVLGADYADPNEVCMMTGDMQNHPGSTCKGDSGAGLACFDSWRNDGRFYLAGSLSNGPDICGPGKPTASIYANLWKQRRDLYEMHDRCSS